MANINIDTVKMRENGKDIMRLTSDLNELLISLYKRIELMPTTTLEWTGNSAFEFVRKLNVEKIDYFKMKDILYKYGKTLIESAEEIENKIDSSKQEIDI